MRTIKNRVSHLHALKKRSFSIKERSCKRVYYDAQKESLSFSDPYEDGWQSFPVALGSGMNLLSC